MNILCAGAKLHFVRSFCNTFTPEEDHLRQSYETFLMDVGLGGNVFRRNYNTLGFLAENSWFKHLWQLCHLYGVALTINFPENLPQCCEGNRAIMDVLIDSNLFSVSELTTLQCVRRHKKVHYLSDILCADGRSVLRDMISNAIVSSSRTFSLKKPTHRNFEL